MKKPKDFEKTRYDHIINLGQNCSGAFFLDAYKKRFESQPFDWICSVPEKDNILERVKLLINDFDEFLDIDNFESTNENFIAGVTKEKHENFINEKLGLNFPHDFKAKETFNDSFRKIKEKYERRIERIYKFLNKRNSNILLFYIDYNTRGAKTEQICDEIKQSMDLLKIKNFRANINLVYFYANSTETQEQVLTENALFIEADVMQKTNLAWAIYHGNHINKCYLKYKFKILLLKKLKKHKFLMYN